MAYPIGHAPRVELRVNGTLLGEDIRRLFGSIKIEMDVDRADALSVEVRPVADSPSRKLIDSYLFAEGNTIEASAGYADLQSVAPVSLGMFDLQPTGGKGGREGTTFSVNGLAPAHRMLDNRLHRVYGADYSDSEIVELLAKEYGFASQVSPTVRRKTARTKEAGVSDFALLNFLAAEATNDAGEAFYWRAEWTPNALGPKDAVVLRFGPIELAPPAERLMFRAEAWMERPATIHEWSASPSIKGIPTKISLVWMDRETREEMEVIVEMGSADSDPVVLWSGSAARPAKKADENGNPPPEDTLHKGLDAIDKEVQDGSAVRFHASGETPWGKSGTFGSEQEAIAWARKMFGWLKFGLCDAEFTVPGVPTVRPWQIHDFVGMSSRWDGSYLLTSVTHTLDPQGAYTMQLRGRKVPGANTNPTATVMT